MYRLSLKSYYVELLKEFQEHSAMTTCTQNNITPCQKNQCVTMNLHACMKIEHVFRLKLSDRAIYKNIIL